MFIHFNEGGLLLWCIPLAANHLCHILEVRIFCLKIVHLHPFQSKYSYTCIQCVTKTINHQVRWVWLFSFNSFGNTCKSYVNNDRTCYLIRQMINNMLLSSLMKWKSRAHSSSECFRKFVAGGKLATATRPHTTSKTSISKVIINSHRENV